MGRQTERWDLCFFTRRDVFSFSFFAFVLILLLAAEDDDDDDDDNDGIVTLRYPPD
jgi:hypothetical protein